MLQVTNFLCLASLFGVNESNIWKVPAGAPHELGAKRLCCKTEHNKTNECCVAHCCN